MKSKMKLELDALVVESFATGDAEGARGTVRGHATFACDTENATCNGGATCNLEYTCDRNEFTCRLSCGACNTQRCGGDGTTLTGDNCQSGVSTCPFVCLNC